MILYRFEYEDRENGASGCCDVEAASKAEAITKFREKYPDVDVWHSSQFEAVLCKHCKQPLGNIGLKFDECMNDECPLYLAGKPQEEL